MHLLSPPTAVPHEVPAFLRGVLPFTLRYLRRRPWSFAALLGLVLGAAGCAVAVQYGMKLLVDAMALGPEAAGAASVWGPLVLFLALIATENVCWRLGGWLNCRTIVATGVDIRLDLFQYLAGHPVRYFAGQFSGALAGRITGAAGSFGALSNTLIWSVVPPCVDFLGALLIFLTVDWTMAAALAVFVVLVGGGLGWFGTLGRPLHQDYAREANVVAGELVDSVGNMWAVKAFSARDAERARLAKAFGVEAGAQRRSWLYLEKTRALHDAALWLLAGGMLAWAIHLWSRGQVTPGEVVMVSALTFRILHGSRDLALALIGTTQQIHQIGETLRVIGQPHAVSDPPQAPAFRRLGGSIAFQEVSFAYAEGRRVFERFSLQIPPGQKVGIVGPSGAGKSTLIGLVQRLDDVQEGRILIDGQDLRRVTQDSLRAAIAVVPQEISLFHRSIMDNIRYGRPEASDEEVFAAARAAHCHDFILSLPEGYATPVGERGIMLSGGQRQRVGLARAILKNAPIIILDEATSALDTGSELEIQHALAALMRGRTVLAVAHRLSTLADFDRIVVLEEGRIVEDGHPAELRRRRGAFDALWRLQAEGLAVEEDQPAPRVARNA